MFFKILPMLLLCGIGYGLRRGGMLQPVDAQTIGKLLSLLALPAVILRALLVTELTPDLIYLPLSALLVVTCLMGICLGWIRWGRWERAQAGALVTMFPTFEGGAIAYPLMLLAFGEVGLSRIVLFDLAQAIFLLTVVYCVSAAFGAAGVSPAAIATKLARTPFFWAIILGLIGNGLGIHNPVLLELLTLIGNSFLLLILLLLSLEFQINPTAFGQYLLLALLKIGCGLGLGWGATLLFGLEGVERAAVIVGSALPPSMLTLLFTQEHHLDTTFAVSFISLAVPLYLVLMTPLLNVL